MDRVLENRKPSRSAHPAASGALIRVNHPKAGVMGLNRVKHCMWVELCVGQTERI